MTKYIYIKEIECTKYTKEVVRRHPQNQKKKKTQENSYTQQKNWEKTKRGPTTNKKKDHTQKRTPKGKNTTSPENLQRQKAQGGSQEARPEGRR